MFKIIKVTHYNKYVVKINFDDVYSYNKARLCINVHYYYISM